jgi:D-xylulose reductase
MKAVVLEQKNKLSIRDIDIEEEMGSEDVKIAITNVGICGSDIHYYQYGAIGPYVVKKPMILGHEASGKVIEVGNQVKHLQVGDRVCMEPGIPNRRSKAYKIGLYNLDPEVRFWATPPFHGVMRPTVIHPADFTFKLPKNVHNDEGALIEPLSIGIHAVKKAGIEPGDISLVIGAGTIGLVTALAALAGGCSKVLITDTKQPKLSIASQFSGITPINVEKMDVKKIISEQTGNWGVNIVFEASGNKEVTNQLFDFCCPGGKVVYIGMPVEPISLDIVKAQAKEVTIVTIFRYANVYPSAINFLSSGKIDIKPLISKKYSFLESIEAIEHAAQAEPNIIKIQICLE